MHTPSWFVNAACFCPTTNQTLSTPRQHVILEPLAQPELLQLAGGGVRQLVDKRHVVGNLPFGDAASTDPTPFRKRSMKLLRHGTKDLKAGDIITLGIEKLGDQKKTMYAWNPELIDA